MQKQEKTNIWCLLGFILAFVIPLLGLIFSIIGIRQIKKTEEGGRGLAIAGIIISSVFLAITLVVILMWFILIASTI